MRFKNKCCNVCGSDDAYYLGLRQDPSGHKDKSTKVVKCRHCGLIYPNPMPEQEYSEIQENFEEPVDYFASDFESRVRFFDRVIDVFERMLPDKGRILDIGCGRGELLYAAKKRGWDATGTDISEAFVKFGKERYGVNAMVGDLKDISLPEGGFDAAAIMSVIQYVQDPMDTIFRVSKLMKKGGKVYIEVTNDDALVFRAGDIFKTLRSGKKITTRLSPLFPSFQLFGFNKKSLTYALNKAGFKVLSIKTGGRSGGGNVPGIGPMNFLLNLMRKMIIYAGGITGNGHLIFCVAEKEG